MIDASILVAWFLAEKSDPRVEIAFDTVARVETLAPSLLYYEVRNALLVSERRNRITEAMSTAFPSRSWLDCQFDWSLQGMTRAFIDSGPQTEAYRL